MTNPGLPNKKIGSLFILSGPSGVGKTTLRKKVQKKMARLRFSISWTTRDRRPGERDGRDYRFVSRRDFEEKIKSKGFLEWARVHNEFYGTPRAPIQNWTALGEDVILDIDIQGARQIKKGIPQAVTIFILPPSRKTLQSRLIQRETEPTSKIRLRLENAEREMPHWKYFDYAIVNDDLRASVAALEAIVKAERLRVKA
jgi:guanylate kinase